MHAPDIIGENGFFANKKGAIRLIGLTIATKEMRQMVQFYNAVFDADLQITAQISNQPFYSGKLAGIDLMLCPNSIAGIRAEQNRQQFRFIVRDIEAVIQRGLANHGSEINPIDDYAGAKVASLADPDGNTIEFVQLDSWPAADAVQQFGLVRRIIAEMPHDNAAGIIRQHDRVPRGAAAG